MTSLSSTLSVVMIAALPLTSMQPAAVNSFSSQPSSGGTAAKSPQNVTVTGKLSRAMGIGAESTGWSIELDSKLSIEGKEVKVLEVQGSAKRLDALNNQRVVASGILISKNGVERGTWTVLQVKKIQKVKAKEVATALEGTNWKLTELGGIPAAAAPDSKPAELLLKDNKVSGSGGCNRVMGSYESSGDLLKFSPVAMTRMACLNEAANKQEQAFVKVLESTTSYRIVGDALELRKDDQVLARFEAQREK